MTLDPRVSVYLNVALAVVIALLGGTAMYTDLFGPTATVKILACLGILSLVLNAILHSIPSQSTPQAMKSFYLGPKQQ
jgi:hypothetical protein